MVESSSQQAAEALIFRARDLDPRAYPRVDAHLHTSWTDGKQTVVEAYQAAITAGLTAMLFSEHSRKTSTDWFATFVAEVRALPQIACQAFVGTEVKIETVEGGIDTCVEIAALCDLVIASVHRFPTADGGSVPFAQVEPTEAVAREFELSWAAMANPAVDILGHMFGMCHRRYRVAPPEEKVRALIRRAAETGTAVEINARYHENPLQMISWCREFDALVSFGSDAHDSASVGSLSRQLGAEV